MAGLVVSVMPWLYNLTFLIVVNKLCFLWRSANNMYSFSVIYRRVRAVFRQLTVWLVQQWQSRRVRWLLLSIGVLIIGMIMVYVLTAPATPQHAYQARKVVETLTPIPIARQNTSTGYWRDEMVQHGDNLTSVLTRLGISGREIHAVMADSTIGHQLLQLQVNQALSIRVNSAGKLTDIRFFNDDDNGEKNLVALKKTGGRWQADVGVVDTETSPTFKAVVVKTSARGALAQAGVPVEVRESLNEIFKDKVSLDELQAGDTIRLIYNSLYYRGQELATGDIIGTEISHNGQIYQAYYFDDDDEGNGQYYDASGKPVLQGFAAQPVESTRISSPYGTRFHPILHTIKMHTGIDYAAPAGTPIYAPSVGVVESAGVKGGYGNAIVLRHNASMETLYGHMSAFAAGIVPGSSVKAGDVIGYVGSTGRSTGPHLHYEVRLNGQPVNPASVALPSKTLNHSQLIAFKRKQRHINHVLAAVRDIRVTIAQLD